MMPCDSCGGTGQRALTLPYATTLRFVSIQWRSTAEILAAHPADSVERTALINRLNKLVMWGLVERTGSGRRVLWRRR